MRRKLVIILCLFSFYSVSAQDFKEVKTAQDVIDNYITANGGADGLKDVKSISMDGKMNIMGSEVPLRFYIGNDIFYMNLENTQFDVIVAVDTKKKTGWSRFGNMMNDSKPDDIERTKENIEASLWGYYLDKDKYGIRYELMQNEKAGDNDAYVVDFLNKDSLIQTVYFDTKTFRRVKQIKGKQTSDYSDIKVVESGIYMPYKIATGQGDVVVTKYEFNAKFDKKLLKKPKEKDKKEEDK